MAPAQVPQTGRPLAQRLLEAVAEDQAGDGGAFAAGDDQGIEGIELCRLADFAHGVAHPLEHLAVFTEISLEGEHANGHGPLAVR